MKEFALIKKYFLPLTDSHEFARNLSDDTAKISLAEDEELVISKDLFVQDCHFLLSDGGFLIAKKFLLVNLSDIAASGSKPAFYMLGFSKNKKFDSKFYREFALGLREVQDEFGISLIGGDTVESPMAFFSITIFGIAKKNQILRRNCGEEGDEIFVSGSVGDAGLGLKISQKPGQNLCLQQSSKFERSQSEFLLQRHYCPSPRIELGKALIAKGISKCAIDISDGLLADLNHICQASELGAEIFLSEIPISSSAELFLRQNHNFSKLDLLSFGDDYELIFTAKPEKIPEIQKLSQNLDLKISKIGQLKKSEKSPTISLFPDAASTKKQKIKINKFGFEH